MRAEPGRGERREEERAGRKRSTREPKSGRASETHPVTPWVGVSACPLFHIPQLATTDASFDIDNCVVDGCL